MNKRIEKLRGMMAEKGISNLFVSSLSDIYYLTGFTGSTAYLFVTDNHVLFLSDGRYEEQSKAQVEPDIQIEIISDYRKALEEYAGRLKQMHVTYSCTLADYQMLSGMLQADTDTDGLIGIMRMEKDEQELEKLRGMFACAANAFNSSLKDFQPGRRENEWAAVLEMNMKMQGSDAPSFETIVASGPRGAMPHGKASGKVVEKGDAVVVDFGSKKEYCSDVTRLVKVSAGEEVDAVADIVYTALKKASEAAKPGVKCSDVDAVAREYIESKGYGKYFNHGLGHGVGIDVHEKPVFNPRDNTVLKENMVLTVEPGIYLPGKFGVRLEDTIVIKKDGYENLTAVFDKYIYEI